MGEEHLDVLALVPRSLEGRGDGERSRDIARTLTDIVRDLREGSFGHH